MKDTLKSSMRPGLRVLLIASLGLNLLVAGVVVGGMLDGKSPRNFGGPEMTVGPFSRAFDHDDRDAIRTELRSRSDLRPPSSDDRVAAMQAFLTALRADPFDPAAIDAQLEVQRDRANAAMEAGQMAVMNRIIAMDAEGRAKFAERLEKELMHGDRR